MAPNEAACNPWPGNCHTSAGGLPRIADSTQPSKREVAAGPPGCTSGYSRRQLLAPPPNAKGLLQGPSGRLFTHLGHSGLFSAVLDDSDALAQGDIRARPLLAGCLIYGFGHSQIINVGDVLDDAVVIRIPAVDAIGEGSFRQCRSRLRPVGQGSNSTQLSFLFA